jgi:hypothetical protein
MAKIVGIGGMSPEQVAFEVNRGGKFVVYRYSVSAVIISFLQSSNIYFVRAGESRVVKGLPWTLLSLLLGWWGIPWGPIYTVRAVWANSHGGEDVTAAVAGALGLQGVHWDTAAAGGS